LTDPIFVSSVQKEFAEERRAIRDFVEGDALLRRFFTVFLFEDLPARDRRSDDVYLTEVDGCAAYVALFGSEYSSGPAEDASPTEREFDRATAMGKPRLVFVKGQRRCKAPSTDASPHREGQCATHPPAFRFDRKFQRSRLGRDRVLPENVRRGRAEAQAIVESITFAA